MVAKHHLPFFNGVGRRTTTRNKVVLDKDNVSET